MKTLYESLLDSEDEIFDDVVNAMKKKAIRQFLMKNYAMAGYNISDKPNKDGKYIVNTSGLVIVKTNLKEFTNGDFVFGKTEHGFNCSGCSELTSLEGAPEEVNGIFNCSNCKSLTSLEGAPKKVRCHFICDDCINLISLKGAPKKVLGDFNCSYCPKLTSLEGAPEEVNDFNCNGCSGLTSLKGAPEKVNNFNCSHCPKLTSLKGAPEKVNDFNCSRCSKLTSLKGAPRYIERNFHCNNCKGKFTEENVKKVSNVKKGIYV